MAGDSTSSVSRGQLNSATGDSSAIGSGYQRTTPTPAGGTTGEFDWFAGTLFEEQWSLSLYWVTF
jgi:hypothetical protein